MPDHHEYELYLAVENIEAAARLRARWPTVTLVHTPVHASWLNQVEIYFSIVQRKVVTPNDFTSARPRGAAARLSSPL